MPPPSGVCPDMKCRDKADHGSALWRYRTTAIGKREERMEISARNQLKGKIKQVTPGAVMSEVVVDVGGQEVVALITKASVERLGLKPGDAVVAIIKSTEVMIGK